MSLHDDINTIYNLAIKYMDCLDVEPGDPQRLAAAEAYYRLIERVSDTFLLDWIDSHRTEDQPRFVVGISRVGKGFYLKSCHDRQCHDNVRDAIRKIRAKVETTQGSGKTA